MPALHVRHQKVSPGNRSGAAGHVALELDAEMSVHVGLEQRASKESFVANLALVVPDLQMNAEGIR